MGDGDDDRPLLRDSKLAPEQIEILNKAFDRALRALHLVDRGDPICEMVARTIIEVAKKWHARSRRDCRGNCKAAWAALTGWERMLPFLVSLTYRPRDTSRYGPDVPPDAGAIA